MPRWLADAGYQGIQRLSRLDAQTSGVMPVSLCPEGAGRQVIMARGADYGENHCFQERTYQEL